MHYTQRCHLRKGFSLIELLIVMVIISLLLASAVSNFSLSKPKPKALTPLNLKKMMMKSEFFTGRSTLMCVNDSKKCYLRKGLSANFTPYANKINLQGIKAYTIDKSDALVAIEYQRFHDEKISLVMEFYNNGSSTQMILEHGKKAYFMPAFFGKAKEFDSVDDAKDYWLEKSRLVSNAGEYY